MSDTNGSAVAAVQWMEVERMKKLAYSEIANRYPLMEGTEFHRFCERVRDEGFDPTRPIILLPGGKEVLEGRNRLRACIANNIPVAFKMWDGECGSPENFAVSFNRDRMHYNASQLAMIAADEIKRRTAQKAESSDALMRHSQRQEIKAEAETQGVSPRMVEYAIEAQEKSPPAIQQAIRDGEVSIPDAIKVAALPEQTQEEALQKVRAGEARSLDGATRTKPAAKPPAPSPKPAAPAPVIAPPVAKADIDDGFGDAHEGTTQVEALAAAEPDRDANGVVIPADLLDVFNNTMFADAVRYCDELMRITKAADWNPYLAMAPVTTSIELIRSHFKGCDSHLVCTACSGKGCNQCRKTGFLSRWRVEELAAQKGK